MSKSAEPTATSVRRVVRCPIEPAGNEYAEHEFVMEMEPVSTAPYAYRVDGVPVHRDEYMAALLTLTAGRNDRQ